MLWFMAHYANGVSRDLGLGLTFQALLPLQLVADTGVGEVGARAYARRRGLTDDAVFAGFGAPMAPKRARAASTKSVSGSGARTRNPRSAVCSKYSYIRAMLPRRGKRRGEKGEARGRYRSRDGASRVTRWLGDNAARAKRESGERVAPRP